MSSLRPDLGAAGPGRRRAGSRPLAAAAVVLTLVAACAATEADDADDTAEPLGTAGGAEGDDATTASGSPGAPEEPISGDVAIFLCVERSCGRDITDAERDQLHDELTAHPAVELVVFESQEEALERFLEMFADDPAMTAGVTADSLPASFRLILTDLDEAEAIIDRFQDRAGVDEVVIQREPGRTLGPLAAGEPDVHALIYLCTARACGAAATTEERQQLQRDLEADPAVARVALRTEQESHARALELFDGDPVVADLAPEAFPASFDVTLTDASEVATFVDRYAARPGVDEVIDTAAVLREAIEELSAGPTPVALGHTTPATWSTTLDLNVLDREHLAVGRVRSAGAFRAA